MSRRRSGALAATCAPAPSCDPAVDPAHCVVLPLPAADLRVSKTNTPAQGADDLPADTVNSGTTVVYTVVVTNNGPDVAAGAILADTPGVGLTCPGAAAVTCSSPTPGVCPAGPITVGDLAVGVALGTLPATAGANTASFTFACDVP